MRVEAIVTRRDAQGTFVRTGGVGGCGRCDEAGGCRTDILGQMFGPRCKEYEVDNLVEAQPGNQVAVDIPDGIPLRAALLAYVWPLACMFGFATLAWLFVGSELAVIVASAAGLVCSILLLRSQKHAPAVQGMRPKLVDILDSR